MNWTTIGHSSTHQWDTEYRNGYTWLSLAQLHLGQIKFACSNTVQWYKTRDAMWIHLGMHFWPKWKCRFRPCEHSFLQPKGKSCSALRYFPSTFLRVRLYKLSSILATIALLVMLSCFFSFLSAVYHPIIKMLHDGDWFPSLTEQYFQLLWQRITLLNYVSSSTENSSVKKIKLAILENT